MTNNILGVSVPLQYTLIFDVLYHLPIISKTKNVRNQHKRPQM